VTRGWAGGGMSNIVVAGPDRRLNGRIDASRLDPDAL
jgi:hypothetical protein